ncbi:MAG: ABC transporter substrate-binding protein, partial [Actinophytocola sp.]|nr:ABC transporter substrate-binding protein [Actinophytocola sp.]
EPTYRASISLAQQDFTSECIQARNAGVEIFSVVADPNTVQRVAASCQRQNYEPQYLQPGATVDAETVSQPGLQNALVQAFMFPFAGVSTPAVNDFKKTWERYGGAKNPGPPATQGWAASKIFETAAKAAGDDLSRKTLVNQLYKFDDETFNGLTVPLSYGSKGTEDASCVFYLRGREGKWNAPNGNEPICW